MKKDVKKVDMSDTRNVWAVYTHSGGPGLVGEGVPRAVCASETTAIRLARGYDGGFARPVACILIDGQVYAPLDKVAFVDYGSSEDVRTEQSSKDWNTERAKRWRAEDRAKLSGWPL